MIQDVEEVSNLKQHRHVPVGMLPGIPEVKAFSASGVWNKGYKSLQTEISKAETDPMIRVNGTPLYFFNIKL